MYILLYYEFSLIPNIREERGGMLLTKARAGITSIGAIFLPNVHSTQLTAAAQRVLLVAIFLLAVWHHCQGDTRRRSPFTSDVHR